MDVNPPNVAKIKKRISEIMAAVALEQQELEDILNYINSIGQANPSQTAGSTSSARNRRKRSKTQPKSAEEELEGCHVNRREKKRVSGVCRNT